MAVNNKPETKAQAIRKRLALARNTSGEGPAAMPAKPRGRPFQKKQPPTDAPPDSIDARAALGDDIVGPGGGVAAESAPGPDPKAETESQGSEPGALPSEDVPPSDDSRPAQAKVRRDSKKRKRGRPRKDEEAHTVETGDAPRARSRGNSGASAGFAGALLVLHAGLATLMKAPEMQISEPEATMYAGALDNFAREFGVPISSKAQAAITLIGVMGMIYVPRFAAITARKRAAPRTPKPAGPPAGNNPDNPPDWGAIAASANQPPIVGG